MPVTIFGIRNCDTMKKAFIFLKDKGVDYDFHDYKADGIDAAHLTRWVAATGWEIVLNRAGTTFRALPDSAKAGLDAEKAIALMLAQPSMIKRPVLEKDGEIVIGFKPEQYRNLFG